MKFTAGSPLSLTAASPGTVVKISDLPNDTFPVVAWAVVCSYVDADGMDTDVQPVFVVNGHALTTFEWYRTEGPERGVTVVTE
ncbi:hypothetical protein ABZX30_28775 [Streptomyces sp. NPDC004542]|uniref:hypothetical protein n=1 Tax=Streptomyces sp. NPDC004542 TaxID=3154281 RepID=UPI0033B35EF3